jgi:Sigma-70, non-essential region
MRLAESHGVVREDFLKNYLGSELDPLWLDRVSKLSARGWNSFVARDTDRIKELRGGLHALATEIGLEIGEVHKIVHLVQKTRSQIVASFQSISSIMTTGFIVNWRSPLKSAKNRPIKKEEKRMPSCPLTFIRKRTATDT